MPVAYFSMEARPYPGVGLRLSQSSLDEARVCKLISGPGRVRPLLAAADEEILPGGIGLPTHKIKWREMVVVLADSEKMEHSWLGPGVGQYILKVTPTLNLIALCPRGHQNDNDTHI